MVDNSLLHRTNRRSAYWKGRMDFFFLESFQLAPNQNHKADRRITESYSRTRPKPEVHIHKKTHFWGAWQEIYYLGDPPPRVKCDAGILLKSWEATTQVLIC